MKMKQAHAVLCRRRKKQIIAEATVHKYELNVKICHMTRHEDTHRLPCDSFHFVRTIPTKPRQGFLFDFPVGCDYLRDMNEGSTKTNNPRNMKSFQPGIRRAAVVTGCPSQ